MVETLIYYDGDKLQLDLKNNILYLWYNDGLGVEYWFEIKADKEKLMKYLSNEIPVRDLFILGKVSLFEKDFMECKNKNFSLIETFEGYDLPTEDSYLGFNYFQEN